MRKMMTWTQLAAELSQLGTDVAGMIPKAQALKDAANNVPPSVETAKNSLQQKVADLAAVVNTP